MSLAAALAEHLVDLGAADLPEHVLDAANACVLDTVGVALAGSVTPWARAAVRAALLEGGIGGRAHVLGTSRRTTPGMAALANGTSGHSWDFDDDNAQVHAGAAIVPTVVALAEGQGISGEDVLRAVVVGYEAAVRTAWAFDPDALYARGFHPTGIGNAFGCTAAAATMLDLDADGLANALGIAGSMAGGLLEFYGDGAMTKRLHAGHPAYCGVMAARLAAEGFTGPAAVFEGSFGALRAYSDGSSPDALTDDLEGPPKILETARKYYPMNFSTHGAIDLILAMRSDHGLAAEQVRQVRVAIRPFVAPAVGGPATYRPRTILAAQMSMPYAVAVALTDGPVTLDHLTEERIADAELLEIAKRVVTVGDASLDAIDGIEAGSVLPTRIEVERTDGTTLEGELLFQRGDPRNPLTAEQLEHKFLDCAGRVVGEQRAADALRALRDLRRWEDCAPFMTSLRVDDAPGCVERAGP